MNIDGQAAETQVIKDYFSSLKESDEVICYTLPIFASAKMYHAPSRIHGENSAPDSQMRINSGCRGNEPLAATCGSDVWLRHDISTFQDYQSLSVLRTK